jgi:hypothetical protein
VTVEYRLNYGNGQVLDTGPSLKVARQAFTAQVEADRRSNQSSYALRIERYAGDGEWETVPSEAPTRRRR